MSFLPSLEDRVGELENYPSFWTRELDLVDEKVKNLQDFILGSDEKDQDQKNAEESLLQRIQKLESELDWTKRKLCQFIAENELEPDDVPEDLNFKRSKKH